MRYQLKCRVKIKNHEILETSNTHVQFHNLKTCSVRKLFICRLQNK